MSLGAAWAVARVHAQTAPVDRTHLPLESGVAAALCHRTPNYFAAVFCGSGVGALGGSKVAMLVPVVPFQIRRMPS